MLAGAAAGQVVATAARPPAPLFQLPFQSEIFLAGVQISTGLNLVSSRTPN